MPRRLSMACLLALLTTPAPAADPLLSEATAHYWPDLLRRHPVEATLFIGDHRFDDRVNNTSPAAYDAWIKHLRAIEPKLLLGVPYQIPFQRIPRRELADQVDLEVLAGMVSDRIEMAAFGDHLIPLAQVWRTPTDIHSDDLHLAFAQLGQFHPASTVGDVENYVRRLQAFPGMVDGIMATLKLGMEQNRMPPRVTVDRVVTQLRTLSDPKVKTHPLWAFTTRLPEDWPDADRRAAADRVRQALLAHVIPAYTRLAAFVATTYRPACRDSVGLCATPDGAKHYAFLVRHYTTTDLAPDRIHEIGLEQLAKVRAAMDAVRVKVGFQGDLKGFLLHVRDDPALKNRDGEAILARHRAIVAEMADNLRQLLLTEPRTPLEVRAFDPVRARSSPTGEYLPPPADGSRPGIFFVNTLDPATRPTYTMQALAYHEAIPGHHLQGAIAAEAAGRPAFRRFVYIPAFDEGWALYAEGLPAELGLYRDPYAELGRLNYDAIRCVRLVIDTGIHARGWTRDQAVAFFEASTSLPRNEIENEVDRYIAWPGQALAYKIGELKIREIRAKWEQRDGAKFNRRAFHDRLLSYGSVPLDLLGRLMWDEPARAPVAPPR